MPYPLRPFVIAAPVVALTSIWPLAAHAHPHIFIDAGLRLVMEEGRVTAVEVTWLYDELYTLILLEDYGLDPDFDLVLTPAEISQTLGFDLNWSAGFEGGLELRQGDETLTLGAPEAVSLALVGDGQFLTTHRRPVMGASADQAVTAQVYDPDFYIAFEMTGDMTAQGAACDVALQRADLDAAYAGLEAAIEGIGGSIAAEDNFPAVGALFADQVVFSCGG